MNDVADLHQKIKAELAKAVVGQDAAKDELYCTLIAGGHALLEGVPGVAKTLLVRSLAVTLGAGFRRIQFTPDLMPSDVTGSTVFDLGTSQFYFRKGPLFTDLLLADEINRTPPKTQSALLEAMQERSVTYDGEMHPLSDLFMVVATQNPLEFEGTYPLPEAQLDRFMTKTLLEYPEEGEERELLDRTKAGFDAQDLTTASVESVTDGPAILRARRAARSVRVSPEVQDYVLKIVRLSRTLPSVLIGASPRASIALLLTSQVFAQMQGREFVTPDDVKRFAHPVLRHRLILRPEAEIEGLSTDAAVGQLLQQVPVPRMD